MVLQRGPIAESRHRFEAAVVDTAGMVVAASDVPGRVTTFRSSAKPFQLIPLVEGGHADRFGFGDRELAVMASSHTGSADHLAVVSGILERIGCSEHDLVCGYHEPLDPDSRARLASGVPRSPLYNNCSGKHAGMLALAVAEGWPTDGYERPEHPLQSRLRDAVAALCGLEPDAVPFAVDGCGVCVFGVPVERMALAYARLASAGEAGGERERALSRIRAAMRVHPRLAGGAERFSTALIETTGGRLVAKGGAEGLECVALTDRKAGAALKCLDGNDRGVAPAMVALLDHLGALAPEELARLGPWRRPVIRNHAGDEVGALEATVRAGPA